MIPYKLEHVLSFTGKGDAGTQPEIIGQVPEGLRIHFYLTGGTFEGPGLRGKVRPVGGDWVTIRRDGVAVLDVRMTFETDSGALIYMTYPGVIDFGHEGYERFLRGEMPEVVQIRIAPRMSTAHPDLLWLNRLQFAGMGEYRPSLRETKYDIYALK